MSSISNDQEQGQFLTRVGEIPLVKAFCHTMTATYETTKNSNRLIGATLDKAEGYAKYANDQAEPLKKLLDRPLSTVSKIADHQLEDLQKRFPVINTTPHEILEYGQNLYEKSGVKRTVDNVSAVKDSSVAKITDTGAYIRNRFVGATGNGQAALNRYVSGALDLSERAVDIFVATPEDKNHQCASTSNGSYTERVRCISNKLVNGVSYRTTTSLDSIKGFTLRTYSAADNVIKSTTASISASIQKTISDAARIREAVTKEIATRSRAITAKSESAAVNLTKALSNGVANISDRLISSATPFLPEGMEKPAASLVSYTHHWQERMAKASSAGDIWQAAADETKKNLRLASNLLESILNNGNVHVVDTKRW